MTVADAFGILGLSPDASWPQIRQAYLDLSRVWHPDRLMHDQHLLRVGQEKIKDINAAYGLLKNSSASVGSPSRADGPAQARERPASARPHAGPHLANSLRPPPPRGSRASLRARLRSEVGTCAFSAASAAILALIGFFVLSVLSEASAPIHHASPSWPTGPSVGTGSPPADHSPAISAAQGPLPTADPSPGAREGLSSAGGGQAQPKAASPQASKSEAPRPAAGSAPRPWASPGVFTVGSTAEEVRAIQGAPTSTNGQVWHYGLSLVYFKNGRVASWQASAANPLRAAMLSSN